MMKKCLLASLVALACTGAGVFAQEPAKTTAPAATSAASPLVPAVPALFLKPLTLRGTLGDTDVQVHIRPKAEIDEGIEGEYFIFGNSAKILLAGEIEGEILFMEESENGTNISGQWDGKLEGDMLSGTWMSADGSFTKPFALKVVPLKQSAVSRVGKKAAAKADKP